MPLGQQWQELELGPLALGACRIEILSRADSTPLSDVFAAAATDELDET